MASKIDDYLTDLKRYNRRPQTLKTSKATLLMAERDIGRDLLQVKNGEIEDWILSQDISANSKLEYLGRLQQYYLWAVRKELIMKSPINDLMKVIKRNQVKKHPPLTPQQVRELILTAGDIRRMTLMLLAYKTGLRRSELWNLTVDDIDFANKKINIKVRKGGKTGLYVFFDDECAMYLRAYLKIRKPKNPHDRQLFLDAHGHKITQLETLSRIIDPVIAASPYKQVTMHSFRHFYTSHLNMNRIHPKALQVLRGDNNRGMIDYYTEVTEEWVKSEYTKSIPKLNLPVLKV